MKALLSFVVLFVSLAVFPSEAAPAVKELEGFNYLTKKDQKISLQGKTSVVVFLSSKCPCSGSHVGHLAELSKEFKEVQFVGIHSNQNESMEKGDAYFKQVKLPFPVLRDPKAKMANQLGALKTPHVFLLAANGEVQFAGPVSDSSKFGEAETFYLRDSLQALRDGKSLPKVAKRPLGCYIIRE